MGAATDGVRIDAGEIYRQYHGYAQRPPPRADTTAYLLDAKRGNKVLLRALGRAVGYRSRHLPFVTSSNSQRGRIGRFRRPGFPILGDRHPQACHAGGRRPLSRTRQPDGPAFVTGNNTARSRGRGAAAGSTHWPPAIPHALAAWTCWR
jgi:hypothetical protein